MLPWVCCCCFLVSDINWKHTRFDCRTCCSEKVHLCLQKYFFVAIFQIKLGVSEFTVGATPKNSKLKIERNNK